MNKHKGINFKTTNESNFWSSFSKCEIDFHNALGELIDNSLSAKRIEKAGTEIPVAVEVTLAQQSDGTVEVQVADNGKGIDYADLIGKGKRSSIFNLGYQPTSQGHMNEHGFGLKNALAMLTSGFTNPCSF